MSSFKQLVEDYEKEYDRYVAAGLTEDEALDLVTKHIRQGKKPVQEKVETEQPKQETPRQDVKVEKKQPEKKVETWNDVYNDLKKKFDTSNLYSFDKYFDKYMDKVFEGINKDYFTNFFNQFKTEEPKKECCCKKEPEKKVAPKPEPREESKEVALANPEQKKLADLIKSGENVNVISNKPNHIEYEINKPDSYYKYTYKSF